MKYYPQIPRSKGQGFREFQAYVFDKLDGSNLRVEWSKKRGWYKYGTRECLFDKSDGEFGEAIDLFKATLEPRLDPIIKKQKWDRLVVFMEFWGDQSFAGQHIKGDPKRLTLFDVSLHKTGIIGPAEFQDLFGELQPPFVPRFLGKFHWTRGFVEEVRKGNVAGVSFEGVVGKSLENKHLIMSKAKTQAWIDKVIARYGVSKGNKILNS